MYIVTVDGVAGGKNLGRARNGGKRREEKEMRRTAQAELETNLPNGDSIPCR